MRLDCKVSAGNEVHLVLRGRPIVLHQYPTLIPGCPMIVELEDWRQEPPLSCA